MIYGYARGGKPAISDEALDKQISTLKKAGADKIFINRNVNIYEARDKLQFLMNSMEPGATLMCTSIQMACASVFELLELVDILRQNSLRLQVLDSIVIDCRKDRVDKVTQAYLDLCEIMSELTENMIEIQGAPRKELRKHRKIGRPRTQKEDIPAIFMKYYPLYLNGELTIAAMARVCGLSRPTIYKYIRMLAK